MIIELYFIFVIIWIFDKTNIERIVFMILYITLQNLKKIVNCLNLKNKVENQQTNTKYFYW